MWITYEFKTSAEIINEEEIIDGYRYVSNQIITQFLKVYLEWNVISFVYYLLKQQASQGHQKTEPTLHVKYPPAELLVCFAKDAFGSPKAPHRATKRQTYTSVVVWYSWSLFLRCTFVKGLQNKYQKTFTFFLFSFSNKNN